MTLYLDTSALLKLYVVEPHSKLVRRAVERAEHIALAVVAYAEARAALAHRHRDGSLDDAGLRETTGALEQDWPTFTRLEVTDGMARLAGSLAERYALRGFDAVHLAAALMWHRDSGDARFLGFDNRLNEAAGTLLQLYEPPTEG